MNDWRWKGKIGRLKINFSWRSPSNVFGRFGAGWQWKVGIQIGAGSILFSLLVAELMLSKVDP